jgi:hypothetical protein
VDQKTVQKPPTSTEVYKDPAGCGGVKRKRAALSEEEVLVLTNMTDVVNNVAHALRETRLEKVHLTCTMLSCLHPVSLRRPS